MTDRPDNPPAPNPGSEAARKQGCKCPVMDNHYGEGMPYPDGPRFWISEDCQLHSLAARGRT